MSVFKKVDHLKLEGQLITFFQLIKKILQMELQQLVLVIMQLQHLMLRIFLILKIKYFFMNRQIPTG